MLNGNDPSTSDKNLVSFGQVTTEFVRLKCKRLVLITMGLVLLSSLGDSTARPGGLNARFCRAFSSTVLEDCCKMLLKL